MADSAFIAQSAMSKSIEPAIYRSAISFEKLSENALLDAPLRTSLDGGRAVPG